MNQGETLENELINGFVQTANTVPGIHITQEHVPTSTREADRGIDALAKLWTADNRPGTTVLIEVKKSLFPRDLPQIVWTFQKYQSTLNHPPYLFVVLADTISTGAREWMQAERVGYYDSSGSLFLPMPDAYILIDRPTTKKQSKTLGSVFEGRRQEVIEALWEAGREWRNVKEVADRIYAAPSLVSATYQALEQHEWVEVQGSGPAKVRRLKNWENLLDTWTDHERRRDLLLFGKFFVPAKPQQIAKALNTACEEANLACEITGEMGANAYASAFSSTSVVRCRMLGRPVCDQVFEQIGAKPVAEGWNLAVIPGGASDFWFKQVREGIMYASPLRTYLDLQRIGGRGRDGAQLLREQRLRLP